MWQTGGQFAQTGETTAQLKIAKAPFIYGMAVLCAAHRRWCTCALIAQPPPDLAEGEGAAL